MPKIVLYEPEIAMNVGAIIRLAACFNTSIILIEPMGFSLEDRVYKRVKMDYKTDIEIYNSFNDFMNKYFNYRKILFTPHSSLSYTNIKYQKDDLLIFGRESNGVENYIAAQMNLLVSIPMHFNCRSLNLATSVAIALSK